MFHLKRIQFQSHPDNSAIKLSQPDPRFLTPRMPIQNSYSALRNPCQSGIRRSQTRQPTIDSLTVKT